MDLKSSLRFKLILVLLVFLVDKRMMLQSWFDSKAAAHLTQLTVAKFGIITEIRTVVAEQAAGGGISSNEVNVATSASALSQGTGTATARITGLDTKGVGQDLIPPYDSSTLQTSSTESYLYITNGGAGDSSAMSAGKLCIYIHGFVEPDDA